ncbi:stress response protein YvgO [Streptomyces spiroverticillatus]|uniref:Stress response protein YvgO n=1 Tax=Streptomyces finlayi TaxID=67296 RepID=A0A918WVD3_9ACTN|nr:stress protein [Streptomyces finlayi]GHA02760.1 stress response protein YvgO [Streptomyces spiroverticillatus]GHC86996.1 stress response protein YvgO [Streptomyces finlayi]
MRRPTALATLALTALAFTGTAVLPAHAAERPAAVSSVAPQADASGKAAIQGKGVTVTVSADKLGSGNAVAEALRGINTDDRGSFVQQAVEKAFNASGGRHNVMLFNLSQGYDDRFSNVKIYANVKWGNVYYGLWIFENGEFTNTGDGGWINWGMYGWFERNGGHVKFNRSW